jgi:alkylated DNA repair dioxygenase AlkB
MQRTELTDGGYLLYQPDFYVTKIADKLFNYLLDSVPWKQETFVWGKFPRLTSYYADKGVKYQYSGVTHEASGWPEYLSAVKDRLQEVLGEKFNSLLLNFYRDGSDSISWHSDDEKELGTNPTVASISLGGERTFQIRHKTTKEKQSMMLNNGSLIVMGGTMQHHWQHCVPKTTKPISARINLTFRNIL